MTRNQRVILKLSVICFPSCCLGHRCHSERPPIPAKRKKRFPLNEEIQFFTLHDSQLIEIGDFVPVPVNVCHQQPGIA